jgi:hypothetical protein
MEEKKENEVSVLSELVKGEIALGEIDKKSIIRENILFT